MFMSLRCTATLDAAATTAQPERMGGSIGMFWPIIQIGARTQPFAITLRPVTCARNRLNPGSRDGAFAIAFAAAFSTLHAPICSDIDGKTRRMRAAARSTCTIEASRAVKRLASRRRAFVVSHRFSSLFVVSRRPLSNYPPQFFCR
ncbi:hypothetical protein [Paraburkholderia sp. J94]|uniref:hypothetical protein n=1 Tax=Paraburkholderia sp. J94 TaxID=2805441 RepID=UPI002AB31576|nr:hypothetical protein [Paraburkholderia sp. J94]